MNNVLLNTDPGVTPGERALCLRALAVLHRHYPGHGWGVEIDGALMTVRNKKVVGRWGYRINLLDTMDLEREAMLAGGEYLERFGQRRGAADSDGLAAVERDFKGEMQPC